jgi:hypothetical protein
MKFIAARWPLAAVLPFTLSSVGTAQSIIQPLSDHARSVGPGLALTMLHALFVTYPLGWLLLALILWRLKHNLAWWDRCDNAARHDA